MPAILVVLAILAMPAIAILVIPAACFGFLQIGYCLVGCIRGHGPLVQIWPARTNMASSYKYGPLVQMARLYGAWIEFLTFKRCVYGYS